MILSEQVKELRQKSGFSIMECKKALEESAGDQKKASEILEKRGAEKALKKAERETRQGIVESYIHSNKKSGALVVLLCESDFVAKNDEFKQLAHDLAMQIAAMNPADKKEFLSQPFIKNEKQTIEELIREKITKLGENIKIGKFVKLSI